MEYYRSLEPSIPSSLFILMGAESDPPTVPVPDYRPVERFWPYVDLPEQPSEAELAALSPELSEALFGAPPLPFSVTLEFSPFDGPEYAAAIEQAKASAEYREIGQADRLRHRARFYPSDAARLRALFEIVGRFDATDVLIDDRPVPYARELWLPLMWFLIR
jgi:hypothetical protein